jgi:hypothetical protein
MMTSVESIREGFPFTTIAKQPGLPTYKTIAKVHLKIKANASSIVSELGGGAHGLLGLVLPPATYATLTNVAFNTPVNPRTTPNIEARGTAVQIHEVVRLHKENLRVRGEYNATDKALQQQLINTFDEPYIQGLRDRHTNYNTVSAMHILTHLCTAYGVITPFDIKDNGTKMRAPFDPTQPIKLLFEFADAGNMPYNPDQVVSRAYLLILQTGLYADACRDWRRRVVLTQTWPNFEADFAEAHHDLRIVQTAAHGAGYQSGNAALEDLEANYRRETTEALGQLATSTLPIAMPLPTLPKPTPRSILNLERPTQALGPWKRSSALSKSKKLGNLSPPSGSRNRPNQSDDNNSRNANNNSRNNDNNNGHNDNNNGHNNNRNNHNGYNNNRNNQNNNNSNLCCHTHGRIRNNNHTNPNCRNPSNGHAATATPDNRMGGSEQLCADK